MSTPQTPTDGIDVPEDPEEPVTALEPDTGEDYDPPEVVDLDREANEADQIEQTIEAPQDEDPVSDAEPEAG